MRPEGAADVLRVIDRQNPYMAPRTANDVFELSQTWAATLHRDMTVEWAIGAVIDWYKQHSGNIAPADLNNMWRAHQRQQQSNRVIRELVESKRAAIPPTPEYLAARDALLRARGEETP